MLTKLKELSTQAKVAAGAGLAALLALGIGVAVWQPWNQAEEPPQEPDAVQQEPVTPQEPQEKGLSVKVSGEDVPCTLYEGSGWSVYVPEGWTGKAGGTGAVFTSPDGAELAVDFQDAQNKDGSFFSLSAVGDADKQLQFASWGGPVLTCRAPDAQWSRYSKLFAALAKTFTAGQQSPFAGSYVIPWEPDWQVADGDTVLFLDKDGVILDGMVQEAVEDYMRTWPEEDRTVYTGQYRINGIDWAASYTGLTEGYIDVFKTRVQYRVAADSLEAAAAQEGVTVADGWASLPDSLYLVLTNDGSSLSQTRTVIAPEPESWVDFVEQIA